MAITAVTLPQSARLSGSISGGGFFEGQASPRQIRHERHCDDLDRDISELRARLAAPPQPLPEGLTDRQRAKIGRERARDIAATRRAYLQTCRVHGYQSQRLQSLGGKLRLSPSSRLTAERARDDRKDSGGPIKPWLDFGSKRGQ